jgi:hypothetical protein
MQAKQVVIAAMVVLAGIAAAAGATAAYYWNRATALPTWYTSSSANSNLPDTLNTGNGLLASKLASGQGIRQSNNRVAITLTAAELNQLIAEGLAQSPSTSQLLAATEGINAAIEGDQLRAGVVVNPANLPLDDLPPETQQLVQQTLATMPILRDRNVYVGLEGSPRIENGRLVLGDDTHLRVGNLRLSMDEVSRLTGLNPQQLSEQVNLTVPQAGVMLDGIEFVNGEAILQGTMQ